MSMPQGNRPRSSQGSGPAARGPQGGGQPPADYLEEIAFEKKPPDPELFNGIALRAAKAVARSADVRSKNNKNKTTQLRRFYDELCLWERRVSRQPDKFREYLPFIRMINAKVAYARSRDLVDDRFVDLMRHSLGKVTDAETLTYCKLFWEAFMGFYKQERQD